MEEVNQVNHARIPTKIHAYNNFHIISFYIVFFLLFHESNKKNVCLFHSLQFFSSFYHFYYIAYMLCVHSVCTQILKGHLIQL